MIFGKRGRAAGGQAAGAQVMQQHAPQQAAPQVSQQQAPEQLRVFPAELWDDGPVGKLLRDLGMSPDDESNLVPPGRRSMRGSRATVPGTRPSSPRSPATSRNAPAAAA